MLRLLQTVSIRNKSQYQNPYEFFDNFLDSGTLTSINGTPSIPGTCNRLDVDTQNKNYISGDYYSFSGKAAPGYGDPGLWLDAQIIREAGKTIVLHILPITKASAIWGLDENTAGTLPSAHGIFFQSSAISVWDTSSSPGKIGDYTIGNDYYLSLVLRSSGIHYFIYGNPEYPQYTLLWSNKTIVLSPLYIFLCNHSIIGKSIYAGASKELWLPSPIVSDSFERGSISYSDGLGHNEIIGLGAGGYGVLWISKIGTLAISSNKAQFSALVGGIGIATTQSNTPDVNIEVTLTRSAGISGIVIRYVDSNNYIYGGYDGVNWIVVKRVEGVETTVLTAVAAIGAGNFKINIHGSRIYAFYNNTSIQSGSDIGDAKLQTSILHGIYSTNIGNAADNFVIWSRI